MFSRHTCYGTLLETGQDHRQATTYHSIRGPCIAGLLQDCHIDGLVQDCSISIANTLEILQPCTKPLISASGLLTSTGTIALVSVK